MEDGVLHLGTARGVAVTLDAVPGHEAVAPTVGDAAAAGRRAGRVDTPATARPATGEVLEADAGRARGAAVEAQGAPASTGRDDAPRPATVAPPTALGLGRVLPGVAASD